MLSAFFFFFASGNMSARSSVRELEWASCKREISFLGDRYGRKTKLLLHSFRSQNQIVLYEWISGEKPAGNGQRKTVVHIERRNTVQTTSRNGCLTNGAYRAGLAAVIKSSDRLPFVNGLPLRIQTKANKSWHTDGQDRAELS